METISTLVCHFGDAELVQTGDSSAELTSCFPETHFLSISCQKYLYFSFCFSFYSHVSRHIIPGTLFCVINVPFSSRYLNRLRCCWPCSMPSLSLSLTACNCTTAGSIPGSMCNETDGQCVCKDNVQGRQCEECRDSFYNLQENNNQGCQSEYIQTVMNSCLPY